MPTLTIRESHDAMEPAHMRAMATVLPQGTRLHFMAGSHLTTWDDRSTRVPMLVDWMRNVDSGR